MCSWNILRCKNVFLLRFAFFKLDFRYTREEMYFIDVPFWKYFKEIQFWMEFSMFFGVKTF